MGRLLEALPPAPAGMLLMLVSTLAFTGMQTAIRIVGEDPVNPLPAAELAFFRNLFGLIALAPLFFKAGPASLRTRRLGLHLLRAAFQSLGMICFFSALVLIPLAEVTALSFSAPLFATVLALVILRERIRARRVSALIVGFAGVLVVLRPGAEVLSAGALLVLASSLGWAISMTLIKSISRTDSALTLTLYAGLFMTPITLVPALLVWEIPTPAQLAWLLGIGVLGTTGHLAFAQSFRIAEMSAVLPLDFLRLGWAGAVGLWLFAEVPTVWSVGGGALIFAGASYIAVREAQLSRAKHAQA